MKEKHLVAETLEQLMPYPKDGYDGFVLMKYTSTYEFQQEFLDGFLYFNTCDYFARCEKDGQGDDTENLSWKIDPMKPEFFSANPVVKNGEVMITITDYSHHPEDYKQGTVFSFSPVAYRFRKLISFYTLYLDSDRNRIMQFPPNMDKVFGEYGILITDVQEFYRRVIKGLKKMSEEIYAPQLGYVLYMRPEDEKGLIEYDPFIKPSKFKDQNEFRITYIGRDQKPKLINIGESLRDIAFPIPKGGCDEMYIEDRILHFPTYESKSVFP